MDYIIQSKIENGLNKIYLENNTTGEFCVVIPEMGASLSEVYLSDGEKIHSVLDGYKTKEEFNLNKLFKSTILQPFVNRLEGGSYKHDGKEYFVKINYPKENNAIHGFIYNKDFRVIEQLEESEKCSVKLVCNYNGEIEGYPFHFTTEVSYTLNSKGLTSSTKILNRSSNTIPFASGWHPYFKLESKVEDLLLKIPECEVYELNENLIPTGKKENYFEFNELTQIQKTDLDICLGLKYKKDKFELVETKIVSRKLNVELNVWQEVGNLKYNFLQIFIPPKRDSIAIEPQTSCINSFNNGVGSIMLEPGKEIEIKFGVTLSNYTDFKNVM